MRINADHGILITKEDLDDLIISTFVNDIKIIAPKGSKAIDRAK